MRLLPGIVCAVLLSPAASATADPVTCADGTTSEAGRGACSRHGGVVGDRAEPRAERPRATKRSQARKTTTRTRTPAGVLCNDGTRSPSSAPGACSDHGGIAGTIAIERDVPPPRRVARDPVVLPGDGVLCADGTRSLTTGRGACSRHGGVIGAKASQPEPRIEREAAARRSEPRASDTDSILCNDGTVSPIGRGACFGHGGISDGSEKFERHDGPIRERTPSAKPPPTDTDHRPEVGTPIAVCKDGDISYSMHAGGTCSDHGGVAHWL